MSNGITPEEVRRRVRLLSTAQLRLMAVGTAHVVPVNAPAVATERFEAIRDEVQRELQRRGVAVDTSQAPRGIAVYAGPAKGTKNGRYQA